MIDSRKKMDRAIKDGIVPLLRQKGFKGSFPHFKRINNNYVDLLSFMFSLYGGQFVVEIAKCSSKGITNTNGNLVSLANLTTLKIPDRKRLSPTMHGDYWFVYENSSNDNIYQKLADDIEILINECAEVWWSKAENLSKYSIK